MTDDNKLEYDFKYHPDLLSDDVKSILSSRSAYDYFSSNHPEVSQSSYANWINYIDSLFKHKGPIMDFVPPGGLGPIAGAFTNTLLKDTVFQGLNGQLNVDEIASKGAQALKDEIRSRVNSFRSSRVGIGGIGSDKGGGTSSDDYSGGSNFNPHGLSLNLRPIESSFKTDIVPLYRPKFYLDGTESTSPVIIKYLNVWPESSGSEQLNNVDLQNYWDTKIVTDWINVIMRRTKLNSFTNSVITNTNIKEYYQTISYCLAVYYFHASIVAHFMLDANRNEGMIQLYKSLSPKDLQQVRTLGQILDEIPLDPMINQFMFHLYGNYKQSHLPGSPINKFSPIKFKDSAETYTSGFLSGSITTAFNMIRRKPFRDFQQLYVQAFPESINSKVFGYTGIPNFDANFNTLFTNAIYVGHNQLSQWLVVPQVNNADYEVLYNLQTDAPDGWIESANSLYNRSTSALDGGFGGPKTINLDSTDGSIQTEQLYTSVMNDQGVVVHSSCFIYTNDYPIANPDKVSGFYSICRKDDYQLISGNTYRISDNSSGIKYFQRYGMQTAMPKSVRNLFETNCQFMDIMYTPWKYNTSPVGPAVSKSSSTTKSSSPKKKFSRKSKGKGKSKSKGSEAKSLESKALETEK